jgi:signal recognition particle subunit SRP19
MATDIIHLGPFTPQRKYSNEERWIQVYPLYINKSKTVAEGRRVNKEMAVEDPYIGEMAHVLQTNGFKIFIENKVHPREQDKENVLRRCRLRIHLRNDDGSPVNASFPNKKSIYKLLCDTIPTLESRSDPERFRQQQLQATAQPGKGRWQLVPRFPSAQQCAAGNITSSSGRCHDRPVT